MSIEANQTRTKKCVGTRRDGQRCQAPAVTPAGYCFSHDPGFENKRAAARQKGGKNSAKIVRLRGLVPPRLIDVYDTLEDAMKETHDGKLPASRGQAMASIARAMVAVLTSGEIEERVRDLENKFGAKE